MPDWDCAPCGTMQKDRRDQPTCYVCSQPMVIRAAPVTAPVRTVHWKWSNHKNKHVYISGKTKVFVQKSTESKAARYDSGVNIQNIETRCLTALNYQPGIVETGVMVGWFKGEDCTKIQIYAGADNSFHGHPISDDMAESRGGVGATL